MDGEEFVNPDVTNNDGNCYKYAKFMHRLSHAEADYVFWFLFFFQIICLVFIVQLYDSVVEKYSAIKSAERDLQNAKQLEEMKRRVRRISKQCLAQTSCLFFLLLFSNIMQVFAAHAILFCHKESLMHLYFPVWTVFAIGITFATLGCCVTQVYALKTLKLPPFGVALGTPVLVVSAVTHLVWNSITAQKKMNKDIEEGSQPALSRSTTLVPRTGPMSQVDLDNSTVSLANGPCIQIWTGDEPLPAGANAIGSTSEGYLIVEHLRLSSSTSSESSRSSVSQRSIARRSRDDCPRPSAPEGPKEQSGISTRTVRFEEPKPKPKPCCPGI